MLYLHYWLYHHIEVTRHNMRFLSDVTFLSKCLQSSPRQSSRQSKARLGSTELCYLLSSTRFLKKGASI